jgi:hypothetical protein
MRLQRQRTRARVRYILRGNRQQRLDHGNMGAVFPTQRESASEKTLDPKKRKDWRYRDHGTNFGHQPVLGKRDPKINRCRMYTRVFFTSDITDLPGRHVEAWLKKGQRQESRQIKWECPVQQHPTTWKAWKCTIDDVLSNYGALMQPLGNWMDNHHTPQ